MGRKLSFGELKTILVALCLLPGFLCQGGFCFAAGSEPAGNAGQIEAVVIHVDEYAVYAPNLIFYFDTQMDKRKIETFKRVANQLRNKKALITYSSTGNLSKDKRFVLSDIVSAAEKPNLAQQGREAPKPPGDAQGVLTRKLSEDQVSPTETLPAEPNGTPKQDALQEAKSRKTEQSNPVTKSDIVSAAEKPNLAQQGREAPKPPGDAQGKLTRKLSEDKVSPTEIVPAQPNGTPKQGALQEANIRKTEQPGPITKEEIGVFVSRLLYLNGTKDLAAVAPFYADKVDYYDRGIVSRDKVLQDLKYYFRNWAEIDTRLDGDVVMTGFEPEERIVKFISSFSVKNEKKSIAGKTENIWKIQRINGELKLTDVKQKILRRDPSGL